MASPRHPYLTGTSSVPYRSTACRIGTHPACAEASPASAPVGVPLIYEACDCPCHSVPDRNASAEVTL
jgi:hypothetical protein